MADAPALEAGVRAETRIAAARGMGIYDLRGRVSHTQAVGTGATLTAE